MGIVKDLLQFEKKETIESKIGKFTILIEDTFETTYVSQSVLLVTDDNYYVAYIDDYNGGLCIKDVTWIVDGAISHKEKERKRMANEFRRDLKKYREARKSIDD